MLAYPIRRTLPALALAAATAPAAVVTPVAAQSQVREVVSKEVSVGRASAELRLEFADGGRLEVSLNEGSVVIDGNSMGAYRPGGDLDVAWRSLLGQAVALDDGPLAQALADWEAPNDLGGDVAAVAASINRALEAAVTVPETLADSEEPTVSVSIGEGRSLVQVLVTSIGRLGLVEAALEGVHIDETNLHVHVEEDVDVAADETVSGNLVVIDGDLHLRGSVRGDVVVVGGTVELLEGSSVSGAVRLADARLSRNDGSVGAGVIDVSELERDVDAEVRVDVRRELRDEVREEVRRELRVEMRGGDEGFSLFAPFRPIVRGVGGVLENLVAIFVLALIGAAVIAFGGEKVDVIAETAKRSPGRAAAVGMAATVLLIPIWVLGFVALIVSIIGIPVAIAWLPLFPLAAFAAGVVGYLAVARNTGEWLADSDYPWTHWIRKSNSFVTTVGGLVGLMLLFVAANVVSMAPFLRVVTGLLIVAGCVITVLAVEVGLGAVILTRAGRRREHWSTYSADEAWEAAMNADAEGVDIGNERDVGADDSSPRAESGKKGENDA